MRGTLALFGASEKGQFGTPLPCQNITELSDQVGNPVDESRAIELSVQALLYERALIFVRVHEEGFSVEDYLLGFKEILKDETIQELTALALPGVGDETILDASNSITQTFGSLLIVQENDLFDYVTSK
ncbi:MAG: hypothetical protein SP1CHLAM54_15730 [Chlamydiia bacterium]|nr:hypothetical protein [Chlamydiia bacterium]MCH9616462.1 hypothetical protein [Chlamydiia bacterium]MCH9629552.1 hypothetical protein [Chlamydiia bacterium]